MALIGSFFVINLRSCYQNFFQQFCPEQTISGEACDRTRTRPHMLKCLDVQNHTRK